MYTLLHKRRVIVPVVVVGAVVLLLTGARFVAYPAFISAPDHVHIVVTHLDTSLTTHTTSRTIVFDRQFGGKAASAIYAQLVSGERIPPGAITSCPAAGFNYYHYDLTFSRAGIQTSVATSDAQGCLFITLAYLGDRQVFSWHAANGVSFWVRLHQLVNAPLPINAIYSIS
jgi:hypothetical protein